MSELVLVTPVTDAELSAYRETFAAVGEGLRVASVRAKRIVVLQTRAAAANLDLEFLRAPDVELVTTSGFSASAARNLGIARLRRGEDRYVCFLDADAVPSVGLLRSVRGRLQADSAILVGRVHWHDRGLPAGFEEATEPSRVPIGRLLLSAYLCSTFLPVAQVLDAAVRFDESIGPGESTCLKSGEDVLFLTQLVVANDATHALRFDARAFHPSRPRDFSKHLAYAEGQGSLFVRLLRSPMRTSLKAVVFASFGLFLGNALLRVLTFRRRSARILALRLRGAWRALLAS
jgi:hypothetical protein